MPDPHAPARSASLNDWARLIARRHDRTRRRVGGRGGGGAGGRGGGDGGRASRPRARRMRRCTTKPARPGRGRRVCGRSCWTLASRRCRGAAALRGGAWHCPKGPTRSGSARERRKRAALREAAELQRDVLARCAGAGRSSARRWSSGGSGAPRRTRRRRCSSAAAAARSAARAIATNLEGEPRGFGVRRDGARGAGKAGWRRKTAERMAGQLLETGPG